MTLLRPLQLLIILSFLLVHNVADCVERDTDARDRSIRLKLGEKMYREGILPSGEPMIAYVKGDIPVSGAAFSCISCHLRSGLGSFEGGVYTPPTTGTYLYKAPPVMNNGKHSRTPQRRPVYNDETLAGVLRGGVDPAGRLLDYVMPRYHLHDEDMAILIEYLKSLSSQAAPGVSDTELHFATVITPDVSQENADVMYNSLEKYLNYKNNLAKIFEKDARKARMAEGMLISREVAYKRIRLSRWQLNGPADTWQAQLEEFYRKEPVFALLGGISAGDWEPVHRFCETHKLPSILPLTDYPVVSDKDWYTLYFSKGLSQEGEAVAKYLNNQQGDSPIVQIVRASKQGTALAKGFTRAWVESGRHQPVTVEVKDGEQLDIDTLRRLIAREKPTALIAWVDSSDLARLELLLDDKQLPESVFVSGGYLGNDLWTVSKGLRSYLNITFPYRTPNDERQYAAYTEPMQKYLKVQDETRQRIVKHTYTVNQILSMALIELKGEYYRDALLDVIGMGMGAGGMGGQQEQMFPLYERLSFGPGQRYASKGCFIVQLSADDKPKLIKKSDWVIH